MCSVSPGLLSTVLIHQEETLSNAMVRDGLVSSCMVYGRNTIAGIRNFVATTLRSVIFWSHECYRSCRVSNSFVMNGRNMGAVAGFRLVSILRKWQMRLR